MEGFRHSHSLDVRFSDCDMMGHVNNAVYLSYFEEARAAYWRELMGEDYSGFSFILAETTCRYHRAATHGDHLLVGIRLSRLGGSSFDFHYEIRDQHDRCVATGQSVQVMYDYDAARTIPIAPALRERMEAFEARG